eukprot:6411470-Prymnesium_polylepis.1
MGRLQAHGVVGLASGVACITAIGSLGRQARAPTPPTSRHPGPLPLAHASHQPPPWPLAPWPASTLPWA